MYLKYFLCRNIFCLSPGIILLSSRRTWIAWPRLQTSLWDEQELRDQTQPVSWLISANLSTGWWRWLKMRWTKKFATSARWLLLLCSWHQLKFYTRDNEVLILSKDIKHKGILPTKASVTESIWYNMYNRSKRKKYGK